MNLVILDRDGVINEVLPGHVRTVSDWRPIPRSLDAIARLNRAGCRVIVATNQSGIRRRHFTFEDLNRIHEEMYRRLAEYGGTIDAIFICPCHPNDGCECFKPRPGMLNEIAERLHVSLEGVPFIGTRRGTSKPRSRRVRSRYWSAPVRAKRPCAAAHARTESTCTTTSGRRWTRCSRPVGQSPVESGVV